MHKLPQIFDKLLFWGIVILLGFIPLYPKFPLLGVTGTFVSVRLEDILVLLVILLWVITVLIKKDLKKVLLDPVNQSIGLFLLIGGVSLFSAVALTNTANLNLGVFHYLRRAEFMLLLPVVFYVINSKKQIKSILIFLLVVLALVNGYALGQQYLNWPVISTTNSEFSKGLILYLTPGARVNSTFAGHYDLAVFLTMSLVMISALFFLYKRSIQIILLLLSGLTFYVLILTAARQSFAAAILGVMAALFLTGKKTFILLIVLLAVGALVYPSQLRDRFMSTITVNVFGEGERFSAQTQSQNARSRLNIPTLSTPDASKSAKRHLQESTTSASVSSELASDITPGEPIDSTQLGVYRSFNIRIEQEWPRAIRAFVKNPILGTGYSSVGLAVDNDFLRSFAEVGLLGTIGFAIIFVVIIKRLNQSRKSSDKFVRYFSSGIVALIFSFVLNGVFIDVFESSKVAELFWMMVGLGLAAEKVS